MVEAAAPAAATQSNAMLRTERGPYLAPIERPSNVLLKVAYWFMRRQFGKVMGPVAVFSARMPWGFTSFSMKVSSLDKKLVLPRDTAILVRERVAGINGCLFCQDAARWAALRESMQRKPKLDALHEYASSPLFSEAERAALDYATELTRDKYVSPETFARLRGVYSEREICDIVWLVASEHLWNMSNIGLGIGSDGMCELEPSLRAAG
ncbi:MAG TPA: carboxymuconolactone decarboxylase family protein [Chloroflexota bacterium]|jgi:alkylhydroperoxidase family enzyme